MARPLPILLALLLALSSSLSLTLPAEGQEYSPPHKRPGPASDRILFRAFAVEIAPRAVERGDIDLYFFSLKTLAAKELVGKPGIRLYRAPATTLSIILNPAPAPEGELNPFSLPDVRYAMQFLINREFIADEIFQGFAVPMITHLTPFDADYQVVRDAIAELGIRYDPEFARSIITDAMKEAGAELREGRWYYNGKPVSIRFIVRVEDERREIGDLLAAELDRMGFTVERIYQPFGPAIFKVYSTDPITFEWHMYTEGWGRGAAERYDFATLNQMYAPWLGNMPGWQEFGFWQYENPKLDELGQRIFRGDFRNLEERNQLYREATLLGVKESVRIWVAAVINNFPVREEVRGITSDVAIGPKSLFTLREAFVEGRDELKIGNLWVWTERTIWNPVGGFTDVYSVDIWRGVSDPPLARHPFTGVPMPFRATYSVETAGPEGKLEVPSDAFRWSAEEGRWIPVGTGVQATSKVIIDYSKYFASKWHHGIQIGMEDVLYGIFQTFDMVFNPEKSKIEVALAATSRPFLEAFKGFRLLNDTALEVYVDFWHFVPDYIAEFAQPTSLAMPWEILAATDDLVFKQRKAAYSQTAATRFQVRWLSLVARSDAQLVVNTLRRFLEEGFYPKEVFEVNGRLLVSVEEAQERYRRAIDWFREHNILVIGNGPFRLVRFDPPSQFAELEAFRDPSYPFRPGDWFFGEPLLPRIEAVRVEPIMRGSSSIISIRASGPPDLRIEYAIIDPATQQVLARGVAKGTTQEGFLLSVPAELTKELEPGNYQLRLSATSEKISFVDERLEFLQITPLTMAPAPQEEEKPEVPKEEQRVSPPREEIELEETPSPTVARTLAMPISLLAAIIGGAVLALVGIVVLVQRRRGGGG